MTNLKDTAEPFLVLMQITAEKLTFKVGIDGRTTFIVNILAIFFYGKNIKSQKEITGEIHLDTFLDTIFRYNRIEK